MTRTIVKATVTGVTLLLSGVVMAAIQSDTGVTFQMLDADENGLITVEEAKRSPALESVFINADADQDRQLTESEFSSAVTLLGG